MSIRTPHSLLIADVGISMGDEGKGRLIPELVRDLQQSTGQDRPVAVVLKVNGGANSGHTAGGLKLNLLPAGVVEPSVATLAIGSGVVADPRKFHWELASLSLHGHKVEDRLLIDEHAMVSDLSHRLLDLAWESYRVDILGQEPRGSTGRGISPAYADEVSQWQIYYADFLGPREAFARKLEQKLDRALRTIRHVCQVSEDTFRGFFRQLTEAETRANHTTLEAGLLTPLDVDFDQFLGKEPWTLRLERLTETYWQAGTRLKERIGDVRECVLAALTAQKYVIGEFGQAYWLDKRHGFSPNVTASHTYTPELFQSAGIPAQAVHTVGVAKAYDTKVGTHLFLTEIEPGHPLGDRLRRIEFGTSTGRQRMVGWYDAVEKGDTLRYGGFDDLMINKIDALHLGDGWQGNLRICHAYRDRSGNQHYHVPRNEESRKALTPIYADFPGWEGNIRNCQRFGELPENARLYVAAMVSSVVGAAWAGQPRPPKFPELRYLGVGPNPSEIIKDVPPTSELLAWPGLPSFS